MEHLMGLAEQRAEYVTLPTSLLQALYELQKEPSGYEWGGGIDFEIVNDEAQVERILAYFGETGKIPERVAEKYRGDVEVLFHTHPNQGKVQPSPSDLLSFFSSHAQVILIIAREEIALFEKTPAFKEETFKGIKFEVASWYDPEIEMPLIIAELASIGIEVSTYPKGEASPVFNLNIIRSIVGNE